MYCTIDDITPKLIAKERVIELLDDEREGEANERIFSEGGRVEECIGIADEQIDAELIEHYELPLDPVPPIVKQISTWLAIVAMYNHRQVAELPDTVKRKATWAEKKLAEYKARASQLTKDDPKAGGKRLTSKTDDDRVFSSTLLGKMP